MDFEQLGRKELQALAKQYKIKANLSNAALVEALKNAIVIDYENSRIEDDEILLDDEPVAAPPTVAEEPVAVVEQPVETVVAPVAAAAPEAVEEKVSGKKRKVAFGPETAGPFSVDEAAIETTSPLFNRHGRHAVPQPATPFVFESKAPEPLKIGDKVRVCVDSVWITSVIKRVNKASFRVQMDSGEEATVKPADIRVEEEAGEEDAAAEAAEEVLGDSDAVEPTEEAAESSEDEAAVEPEQSQPIDEDDVAEADFHDAVDDSLVLDASIAMDTDDDDVLVASAAPTVTFVDDCGDLLQSPSPVVERQRTPSKAAAAALSTRHSIAVSTPSAPRSARKSTTSARKSVSTPSRASLPMQPWNSSTKATFHIGASHDTAAATSRGSKTPLSEKKKPTAAAAAAASVKPVTPSRRASTTATATATAAATAAANGSSQPAILPKMNAAQRMRLEALQKKKDAERSLVASINPAHAAAFTLAATATAAASSTSTATATVSAAAAGSQQPPLKKARTVPTPLSTGPSVAAKPPASGRSTDRSKLGSSSSSALPHVATVKPKTAPLSAVLEDEAKKPEPVTSVKTLKTTATAAASSSAAAARKTTPNFDRMHQKTFEKQKALTSCVSRDTKINKNMDTAFAKATTTDDAAAAATATAATEAENQQRVANAAPAPAAAAKATFVTKRKAHVAFDTADVGRKDSDHLGALLSGLGATPSRPSAPAHEPAAKKRKTLSVAEKTTAAAVASKAIVLSRKSEVAPKVTANKAPLVNSRKSIRL